MYETQSVLTLLENPLVLLALGWFLARMTKQDERSASLTGFQAAVEERFKTVFNRLDGLDASKQGHDAKIGELVNKVGELCLRLDMLLAPRRRPAQRSFGQRAGHG